MAPPSHSDQDPPTCRSTRVRRVSQGGRGRPWPSLDLPAYRAPGLRGEPVSTARRPPAVVPLPACGCLCAYAYPPPAASPPPERRSLHGWALPRPQPAKPIADSVLSACTGSASTAQRERALAGVLSTNPLPP